MRAKSLASGRPSFRPCDRMTKQQRLSANLLIWSDRPTIFTCSQNTPQIWIGVLKRTSEYSAHVKLFRISEGWGGIRNHELPLQAKLRFVIQITTQGKAADGESCYVVQMRSRRVMRWRFDHLCFPPGDDNGHCIVSRTTCIQIGTYEYVFWWSGQKGHQWMAVHQPFLDGCILPHL